MRRTIAVIATLCAVAASLSLTSSASARTLAQARAICPDGALCLFEAANWDGKYVAARWGIHQLTRFGFNDKASSFVNDSPNAHCMLEHEINLPWSNGGQWIWTSGWGYSSFVDWEWNDRISAMKLMVSAGRIC
jgi:hypothetical protein